MTLMGGPVRWLKLSTLVLLFTACISESQQQAYRGSTASGSHARGTVEGVYGHPLESILMDDASRLVAQPFNGVHSADQIMAKLPKNPREILRSDTLAAFSEDRASWFRDALRANEAYQWAPQAPLRLYYGDRDVDVYPDDPKRGAKEMESRGGNVTLVPLGPYDHIGVVYHAVSRVQAWFKEIAS